eukprot:2527061-Heterocapsa_arctica.AAC.1
MWSSIDALLRLRGGMRNDDDEPPTTAAGIMRAFRAGLRGALAADAVVAANMDRDFNEAIRNRVADTTTVEIQE